MQRREFRIRLVNGCKMVKDNEPELTMIDAKFGDADHGQSMTAITNTIKNAVRHSDGGIRSILNGVAEAVLLVSGGSAVPLWYSWLCGLAENAPEANEISEEELKTMFKGGLDSISVLTKAEVGDKTMMDALIPATEAIMNAEGSADEMFFSAADAAEAGAKKTAEYVAKFGRAKSFGDATIGTPDAGAYSMMYFFMGLADKF